jgi:hypothetical protein
VQAMIYGEIYNELSGHVHHDITLWALKSFANKKVTLDRDQDKVRALVLILFVSILLFRELSKATWLPALSVRDLRYCTKTLTEKLLNFLQTDNVQTNAGVAPCMIPALTSILAEI